MSETLFTIEPQKPNTYFGNMPGQAHGKEEWLTPPHILRALGEFDLDPCAPVVRPWEMARHHFTILANGLTKKWFGRVWLNAPYGKKTATWMRLLAEHGNGIALTFARTETRTFFPWVWDYANGIFFIKKRLTFYNADGTPARTKEGRESNGGAPSCLIAYGAANADALQISGLPGHFVRLR